jgi:hypothetical protein
VLGMFCLLMAIVAMMFSLAMMFFWPFAMLPHPFHFMW